VTSDTIDFETASPSEIRRFLRPAPAHRSVMRRSIDGAEIGEVDLDPETFGIEPNQAVLHQVVTAQLAAARAGTQSTKTRAEVRGGGIKPFAQKGTGRARAGSSRSPVWIGGGVALGPKPRSYAQKTPKKMKALALRSALSDRASLGHVALIDQWSLEVPSTKAAVAALRALNLEGRVLVVLSENDFVADRSFGNLQGVQTLLVNELNAYDILVNDWVVFTDETLPGSPKVISAVEIDIIEDTDGNIGEIVETEVDIVTDGHGHVTEIIETEVDEVIGSEPGRHHARRQGRGGLRHRDRSRRRGRREQVVRDPHNVLIRPVVSEKSYTLMDNNVYVFVVDPSATKIDVRHAVEQAFDVRVTNVNTLNRKGKTKRNRKGGGMGHRPDTKRAIVTLAAGDSIDLFEN
jgi:large subunit ribosomal protein L4